MKSHLAPGNEDPLALGQLLVGRRLAACGRRDVALRLRRLRRRRLNIAVGEGGGSDNTLNCRKAGRG